MAEGAPVAYIDAAIWQPASQELLSQCLAEVDKTFVMASIA